MPEYQLTCHKVYVYTTIEADSPKDALEKAFVAGSNGGQFPEWEIEWGAESDADIEVEEV